MGHRGRIETPLAVFSGSDRYRWYVLGTVLIGAFMSALDASIVNIALPAVTAAYHSRLGIVEWVSLSYLLTLTLALPALGRLADMFGRKPLYNLGFVVFTLGSFFCGAAHGIVALVLWRVVQATGAALLQSNSLALITQVFPERERGRAIGLQGAVQAAAMSLGPYLGGMLVKHLSCQAIFYVNVPVGLVGTLVAWLVLPAPAERKARTSLDWGGGFTFSVALASLMLVLTQLTAKNWISRHTGVLLVVAAASLVAFCLIERRAAEPFIKLSLFRERNFTIGNVSGMLSYMALFAPLFMLPFYLERVLKLDPEKAGTLIPAFHAFFRELEALGIPTAAVVRGQCLGGAFELALWCGMVFAEPSARLGVPETKLGVFPPIAALALPWRVGGARATQLILTGEIVEAGAAFAMGLVDSVEDGAEEALQRYFDLHLAGKSAVALRAAWSASRLRLAAALANSLPVLEAQYLRDLMRHHDPVEGLTAFLERRPPVWTHD